MVSSLIDLDGSALGVTLAYDGTDLEFNIEASAVAPSGVLLVGGCLPIRTSDGSARFDD